MQTLIKADRIPEVEVCVPWMHYSKTFWFLAVWLNALEVWMSKQWLLLVIIVCLINLPCICGPYGGGGELDTVLSFFILYNNVAMTTTATANSPPIHPSIIYSVVWSLVSPRGSSKTNNHITSIFWSLTLTSYSDMFCIPYVTSFSGLSIIDYHFVIL